MYDDEGQRTQEPAEKKKVDSQKDGRESMFSSGFGYPSHSRTVSR